MAAKADNAVTALYRSPETGALSGFDGEYGEGSCVSGSGGSCGESSNVAGLIGPRRLTVSPDGKNVYVAAQGAGAVVELSRQTGPTVYGISVTSGPPAGGTKVTISGAGFTAESQVKFGTAEATGVEFHSPDSITATSPSGTAAESIDITVTTAAGTSSSNWHDEFTYAPNGLLGGMNVEQYCRVAGESHSGVWAGGEEWEASLLAEEFEGKGLAYDNWACLPNVYESGPSALILEKEGEAPTFDALCEEQFPEYDSYGFPEDPNNALSWNCFADEPRVESVAPAGGPAAGEGEVVIKGSGLKGASAVDFGSTGASEFTVEGSGEIVAKAPSGSPGAVDVTVTTPWGPSKAGPSDRYLYVERPTVSAVEPDQGPLAGEAEVRIKGSGFTEEATVAFGSTPAADVVYDSSTELTVDTPTALGAGPVAVSVSTGGGTSEHSAQDIYTYDPVPTLGSLSPGEGPLAGGTEVTITGTGFTETSKVLFAGEQSPKVSYLTSEELIAESPAGKGTVDVTVETPGGTSAISSADRFSYVTAPTVGKLTPSEGPEAGNTTVTIEGSGFAGVKSVDFGGMPASKYKVDSETEITAEAPVSEGPVSVYVEVTTAGGTSVGTSAAEYTYDQVPTVSALSTGKGPPAGGTEVTITGTGFTETSKVLFAGEQSPKVLYLSSEELIAESPAGKGTVDVTVETPGGTSAISSADRFSYVTAPTVTTLTPAEGPEAGKTTVTIEGSGFEGAETVDFGTTPAPRFKVLSETELKAEAPAGVGTLPVTVQGPGGTSAETKADLYTYDPVPALGSLSPGEGPLSGGTEVIVRGSGFTDESAVFFGAVEAPTVLFLSSDELVVESPAGKGTVNVTVETPGGTSAISSADRFSYVSAPIVTALTPAEGPEAGKTTVAIEGSGFTGAGTVDFGTTPAPKFRVLSETEIEAEAPAGTGVRQVTVHTPGGTSAETKADRYTYDPVPTLGSLSPGEGPLAGGTEVTIAGTGFTETSKVLFAGEQSPKVLYLTSEELIAESPAGKGTVDVTVETPGGTSAISSADRFSYVTAPTVGKLTPSEGPEAGNTTVTIEGSGFAGVEAVDFGATPALKYKVLSVSKISAEAPPGKGMVNVSVRTPGGPSAATKANEYTYDPVPSISSLSVTKGPLAGGTRLAIAGTGFTRAAKVHFGSSSSTSTTYVSPTELKAESPGGVGTVDVTVATAGGTSAISSADRFSYLVAPAVTALTPAEGPQAGNNTVTIEGTGLTGAEVVDFGATPAPSYKVVSETQIIAQAPAGSGGVAVTVTTPNGTSADASGATYRYDPVPLVSSLSVGEGPVSGGTPVVITGTGFTPGASVFFGDIEATEVEYASPEELIAISPPGLDAVAVTVETMGGHSAAAGAPSFTYRRAVVASGEGRPAEGEGATGATGATGVAGATAASVPVPVLAQTGNVAPVTGQVLVKLPGAKDFVLVSSLEQIPFGSVIDATHGTVSITTALPDGQTQTGEFFDGEFTVRQGPNGKVVAELYGGGFSVCPTAAERSHAAIASSSHASGKHVVRKLWANAHGSFSTKGNYAAGAVQGTEWLTEDLCEGTLIRVIRDRVKVTNLVTGQSFEVTTGHSYLAKARKHR